MHYFYFMFRSTMNGSCLYSSFSILVAGNNSLENELRGLSCIELYNNAPFYATHPIFKLLCSQHSDLFLSVESVLKFSVSHFSLDSGHSSIDLVRHEAISMCDRDRWASFLCVLSLSNILERPISVLYPDCGQLRYKYLFSNKIFPQNYCNNKCWKTFIILYYKEGNTDISKSDGMHQPNHFSPVTLLPKVERPRKVTSTFQTRLPLYFNAHNKLLTSSSTVSSSLASPVLSHCLPIDESNPCVSLTNKTILSANEYSLPIESSCSFSATTSSSTLPITASCTPLATPLLRKHSFPENPLNEFQSTKKKMRTMFFSKRPVLASSSVPHKIDTPLTPEFIGSGEGKYDVGTFSLKAATLSDYEILDLIKNVSKPDKDFDFPKNGKQGRKFRQKWLNDYSWLSYSIKLDSAFCVQCSLLHHKTKNQKCASNLISKGQNNWNDSASIFKKHEKSELHKCVSSIVLELHKQNSGSTKSIKEIISSSYSKKVQENRTFLLSVIDTIVLCGRLSISLRGHRDNFDRLSEVGEYAPYSVGNFMDLLNFRVRAGDVALKQHLKSCARNATYVSPQIQNELINCCGDFITDSIISEVKEAKFFSVICDEACDTSTKEQMSLVIRFVDQNYNLREDFVSFVHCSEGLSGLSLSNVILKTLNKLGLKLENCRGQCYDGAGNVAGKINGCQAHILRQNRFALYTHCSSHRLNLVICNSCSIHYVRNMMDQIKQITYFFKFSETRLKSLRSNVANLCDHPNHAHLIDVCKTRWVERIIGMGIFNDLFEGILSTFDEMAINEGGKFNADTSSKAVSYRNTLERFYFIVAMVITRQIFDITMEVTKLLQSKTNDMFKTVILIDSLKEQFQHMRGDVDTYHHRWFLIAEDLSKKVNVLVTVPRTAKRQTQRPNYSFSDVSDYFKKAITIPLLDHVLSELNSRFDHSLTAYHGLVIVPSRLLYLRSLQQEGLLSWQSQFETFSNFYCKDFASLSALKGELEVWERFWVNMQKNDPNSIPDSLEATLKSFPHCDGIFTNIEAALRILATIPMTSCECERSFSAMKRLKNYSRSTMTEERLNGLALLHVHLNVKIDKNNIIDRFSSLGNRRLDFI